MHLLVISFVLTNFVLISVNGGPVTENSITNNHVFNHQFSTNLQNHFGVNKPSKLRLYLLADLAKAASELKPYINCESSVELKITSKNCTCLNYSCQRYYKTVKKPRIFERNCEDVCCGKQRSKGKSLDGETRKIIQKSSAPSMAAAPINLPQLPVRDAINAANTIASLSVAEPAVEKNIVAADDESKIVSNVSAVRCGEIRPDKDDKLTVPWIVQITSDGQDQCMGSMLSSRAVITSSNCVDQTNNITVTVTKQANQKSDNFKIKTIIRDEFVRKSVILVLSETIHSLEQKHNPCLPKDIFNSQYNNCYLGLSNHTAMPVNLLTLNDCRNNIPESANIATNAFCVNYYLPSHDTAGPGAPLLCSWNRNYPNNFQIVGVLSEKYNNILIFDNINRIHDMIKSNLYNLM